jgi:hypothetical protein
MLTVLAAAAIIFLLLHGTSYVFFTGHFTISLPKILDVIASGFLGALAGFLLWSFATLLISISPIVKNSLVQEIGFNARLEQTTIPYLCWWCNIVNAVVAVPANKQTTQQAIEQLRPQTPARKTQSAKTASLEPNKPPQSDAVKQNSSLSQPASAENPQPNPPPAP